MTDGERLVWAASYAIVLDRAGDPLVAARTAALAVSQLREVAYRKMSDGKLAISEIDERDFLDEIVSVP